MCQFNHWAANFVNILTYLLKLASYITLKAHAWTSDALVSAVFFSAAMKFPRTVRSLLVPHIIC